MKDFRKCYLRHTGGKKQGFLIMNRRVFGTVLKTGSVHCDCMYWKEAFVFVLLDDKDTRTYWTKEGKERAFKVGDRVSGFLRQKTGHLGMLKKE